MKLLLGLLAITSCASSSRHVDVGGHSTLGTLGQERIESIPMHLYRQDCWKKRAVMKSARKHSLANALRGAGYALDQDEKPGAGLGEIVPFETVQKDGFYEVECVSDYMFSHGDKFGDNRHSYKVGDRANVSIVLYEREVPKEDREDMTHEVCFAFCRTVPDMLFFGILNGRHCYCTPYYKRQESDSSQCDATCEGKPSAMCGGKKKSSIFQMHLCANTKEDLNATVTSLTEIKDELANVTSQVNDTENDMQAMAKVFQKQFGKVGDSAASDLMQSAKVFAGVLEKAVNNGKDADDTMANMSSKVTTMSNLDFTKAENITKAEALVSNMRSATRDASSQLNDLNDLLEASSPGTTYGAGSENMTHEYYNVMYFVDKEHKDKPSTCAGKAVGKPMVGSKDDCALACNNEVHNCRAFNWFEGNSTGLCFLLSDFQTATFYTNCTNVAAGGSVKEASCMARFSKFEGTSLKPKGNGKCKDCFKKVTKADRCYEESTVQQTTAAPSVPTRRR